MKKRLFGLAVVAWLIFALSAPVLAHVTSMNITEGENITIREAVSLDWIVFNLECNNNDVIDLPSVTVDSNISYSWHTSKSSAAITGSVTPTGTEGNYNITLYLKVSADKDSTYTLTATANEHSATANITVQPWATAPVFSDDKTVITVSLGQSGDLGTFYINGDDSYGVKLSFDKAGLAVLEAMNIDYYLDGTYFRLAGRWPETEDDVHNNWQQKGVNYYHNAAFTVRATADKYPYPYVERTYSFDIQGAISADFQKAPANGEDLGKLYDSYDHGLYTGIWVTEPYYDEEGEYNYFPRYVNSLTFTAKGTLPIYYSYSYTGTDVFNEEETGLWIYDLEIASADSTRLYNATDTKNGTITIYIDGVPKKAGTYNFNLKISNDVNPEGVTRNYKITVLEHPTIANSVQEVTWGEAANFTLNTSNFQTSSLQWELLETDEDGYPIEDDNYSIFKSHYLELEERESWGEEWEDIDMYYWLTSSDLKVLGLPFNQLTGTISGTWNLHGDSRGIMSDWDSVNDEYYRMILPVKATGDGIRAYGLIRLKFKAVAPTVTLEKMVFTWSKDIPEVITSSDYIDTVYYKHGDERYSFDIERTYPTTSLDSAYLIKIVGAGTIGFKNGYTKENDFVDDMSELLHDRLAKFNSLDIMHFQSQDESSYYRYDYHDDAEYYYVYGKPSIVSPDTIYHLTAQGPGGSRTFLLNISVKPSVISLDIVSGEFLSGDQKIGTVFPTVKLHAYPGPVNWYNTNFDALGLTLSVDTSDPEYAYVVGTLSKATGEYDKKGEKLKTPGEIPYWVTIESPYYPLAYNRSTTPLYIWVHGIPVITTKSVKDLTTDKAEKSIATLTADIDVTSWDIWFKYDGDWNEATMTSDASSPAFGKAWIHISSDDSGAYSANTYAGASGLEGNQRGHSYLYVTPDGKKTVIAGSVDRAPIKTDSKGSVATVRILAHANGLTGSKDFDIHIKPVAPKFGKNDMNIQKASSIYSQDITTIGTRPMTMKAYIDGKTANKIFGTPVAKSIDITVASESDIENYTDSNPTGLYFWADESTGTGYLTYNRYGHDDNNGVAYKSIPVTVAMTNQANSGGKIATGTVKLTAEAVETPAWYVYSADYVAPENSNGVDQWAPLTADPTYNEVASKDFTLESDGTYKHAFMVRGDGPITVTPSLALVTNGNVTAKNSKNGVYIMSQDWNAGYATDGVVYVIGGVPTRDKETKTKITLTAKNNSTGATKKLNVNITGKQIPDVSVMKDSALRKEFELGKKINIKLSAKGSKPIYWKLSDDTPAASLTYYGLSLDAVKGTIYTTDSKNGTLNVTANSAGTEYESKDFYVIAYNSAGDSDPAHVKIGIKGKKAKFTSKNLEFYRESGDYGATGSKALVTTDAANSTSYLTYTMVDDKNSTLKQLGFDGTITRYTSTGTYENYGRLGFSKKPDATKGTSIKVEATNYGTKFNGSVKVIVYDPKPVIQTTDGKSEGTLTIQALADGKAEGALNLTLSSATEATNDSKVTWKITGKPTQKGVSAKLTVTKTDKGNTAKMDFSVAKGTEAGDYVFKVQATNSSGKQVSDELAITVKVTAAADAKELPNDNAMPDQEPEAEPEEPEAPEEPEEVIDGTITFGLPRTADSLSTAQNAAISDAGYMIAAVLPEVSADVSGQYEIDALLIEAAPIDGELAYFAFPVDGISTEDDSIADFYDETGTYVNTVPESRKVTVSPWLTEGKVYAPVIAVKVEAAAPQDEDEELEAGDIVTIEALE